MSAKVVKFCPMSEVSEYGALYEDQLLFAVVKSRQSYPQSSDVKCSSLPGEESNSSILFGQKVDLPGQSMAQTERASFELFLSQFY